MWMVAAGVILFTASALQQAGLKTTTAGNAGFLTSLYVVLVPLVLFVGWRRKARSHGADCGGTGCFGCVSAIRGWASFTCDAGDLLELGGAGFWALHVVLLGQVRVSI